MDHLAPVLLIVVAAVVLGAIAVASWSMRARRAARAERVASERHRLDALHAASEYRRALRDYTQLTRHRLANPLTAITAGIATLRDLDLDPDTRRAVLDAMHETAGRLERAVLHPEVLSPEEHELVPTPMLSDSELARHMQSDAVHAEMRARSVNHSLIDHVDGDLRSGQTIGFLCECWANECVETISMPLHRYFDVHDRPDQFVICPGHDLPAVEQVVDRGRDHWVVRKTAAALDAAGIEGRGRA